MKALRLILVAVSMVLFLQWNSGREWAAPGSGLAAVTLSQCQGDSACDDGHATGQDCCQTANCAGCAVDAAAFGVSNPMPPSVIHAAIPVRLDGLAIAPEKEPPRSLA